MIRILDESQDINRCYETCTDFDSDILFDPTIHSADLCLLPNNLLFTRSSLEYFLYTIIAPPILIFGIIGNIISIMVLLSKEMKSSVSSLLGIFGICDTVYLILITPLMLANFDKVALNPVFRQYYLTSRHSVVALANWSSAAAIWVIVAVCVERVIVIQNPFRKEWSQDVVLQIFCLIAITAFLLTFSDHYSYRCVSQKFCNGTQIVGKCFDITQDKWSKTVINPVPELQRIYVRWSLIANAFLGVILPIALLIGAKIVLIKSVKSRNKMLQQFMVESRVDDEALPRHKMERKIEVTAIIVIACFIITKVPSTVVLSIQIIWTKEFSGLFWYNIKVFITFLVIVGKTVLFPILYFSSQNFRNKLCRTFKNQTSLSPKSNLIHQPTYTLLPRPRLPNDNIPCDNV